MDFDSHVVLARNKRQDSNTSFIEFLIEMAYKS